MCVIPPVQARAAVAEQSEIDLGAHIQRNDVENIFAGALGDAWHKIINILCHIPQRGLFTAKFPIVPRPLRTDVRIEPPRQLPDFRPRLLRALQEESCVEGDGALDLGFGGRAVGVPDLVIISVCGERYWEHYFTS
jgi:hypothetical protein